MVAEAIGTALIEGAMALDLIEFAGSCGRTGAAETRGPAFSRTVSTAGETVGCDFAASIFIGSASGRLCSGGVCLFAAGCAPLAGSAAIGMMEAILLFSTITKPKSVFTLNMLLSYATIEP